MTKWLTRCADAFAVSEPERLANLALVHPCPVIAFDQESLASSPFEVARKPQSVVKHQKFFEKHLLARKGDVFRT